VLGRAGSSGSFSHPPIRGRGEGGNSGVEQAGCAGTCSCWLWVPGMSRGPGHSPAGLPLLPCVCWEQWVCASQQTFACRTDLLLEAVLSPRH
jgi:hypothetical protein